MNGKPDDEPLRIGLPVADVAAGMWLAMGVIAALRTREATGVGQLVETTLQSSLLNLLSYHSQTFLTAGVLPERTGNSHPEIYPYGVFQCKDSTLVLGLGTEKMWKAFAVLVELGHLIESPLYADPRDRRRNKHLLKQEIERKLAHRHAEYWAGELTKAGIPAAPIKDIGEALTDPQVDANGWIDSVAHPRLGTWKSLKLPVSFNGEAPGVRLYPPAEGENSQECLYEYGFERHEVQELVEQGLVIQR